MVLLAADLDFDPAGHPSLTRLAEDKPVVLGVADSLDMNALVEAARRPAAHHEALREAENANADWVAIRELGERTAAAAARLDAALETAYGVGFRNVHWYVTDSSSEPPRLINTAGDRRRGARTLSSVLSDVCDERYPLSPRLRNEMLSRRSLTSRGRRPAEISFKR